jgi:SAM-dependent methyltransferase
MIIIKTPYKIYKLIKRSLLKLYVMIKNIPNFYRDQILSFQHYIINFKYNLHNLTEININLGLYHLYKHNINDAILRFKLVNILFDKNNVTAHYWLGWSYFLKNNFQKAINHLQQSKIEDATTLLYFIEHIEGIIYIPASIRRQYRELETEYYIKHFPGKKINLATIFIQKTLAQITQLPNQYNILELGSNIGLIAPLIKKRFPDHFTLTGIEDSKRMIELTKSHYANNMIYTQLIDSNLEHFIHDNKDKFHLVLSFCNLAFSATLEDYFYSIYLMMETSGYFALCFLSGADTIFCQKRKTFVYNAYKLRDLLNEKYFTCLSIDGLNAGTEGEYSIIICRKLEL